MAPDSPPQLNVEPTYLSNKNPFEHDSRIVFDAVAHCYYIDGSRYPTSVSGVVHDCFPSFDARATIDKYYASWSSNKENKYYQLISYLKNVMGYNDDIIQREISHLWSSSGQNASKAGTHTHLQIELSLNELEHETESAEFQQYLCWKETKKHLVPFRTEWSVFDEETLICGQIDSLWFNPTNNTYEMYDWKRCAKINMSAFQNQTGFPPFANLPNTNFGHYCVQQNLYAWMLHKNYGITCASLSLVQVHPDLDEFIEWPLKRIFLPGGPVDTLMKARRDKVLSGEIRVLRAGETKRKQHEVEEDLDAAVDRRVRKQLALERAIACVH